MKEKEASKPPKGVNSEIIIYHYQYKGEQDIIDKIIVLKLKDTSQLFL